MGKRKVYKKPIKPKFEYHVCGNDECKKEALLGSFFCLVHRSEYEKKTDLEMGRILEE